METTNYNLKKVFWGIGVLLVFVILGYLLTPYFYSQQNKNDEMSDILYPEMNINSIDAEYSYENGVHKLTGGISVPTPCHNLETDYVLSENKDEAVINFRISTNKDAICAQVVTDKFFNVSFDGPKNIIIRTFVNGKEVTFNAKERGSVINKG